MSRSALPLFSAVGIEIEYAIVDRDSLDVRALADLALRQAAGSAEWVADHDDGEIAWSNELAAHVLELKTNGPAPSCAGLGQAFQESVDRLCAGLETWSATLLPTGMHPWMQPRRETKLWSHGHAEVYRTFDRLFDCRRHGWANVHSTHLNLPFAGEDEFGRLHAAVRVLLPVLAAMSASSPIVERAATGLLDNRLEYYRKHTERVPAMAARVIPEPIWDFAGYREGIFAAIDAELAPLDPEGVLTGQEWTNARGAIARFERDAIEIRVLDTQECPRADVALCALVAETLRALVEGRWSSLAAQQQAGQSALEALFLAVLQGGPAAPLPSGYAGLFGAAKAQSAGQLWTHLVERAALPPEHAEPVELILERGPLAQRILDALGPRPSSERLSAVYTELSACLAHARLFEPEVR